MAQVTVDVSDKIVDAAIKKELKRLQKRIKGLELSNAKLKDKIRQQNFKVEEAKRIVVVASAIAAEFGDEWED